MKDIEFRVECAKAILGKMLIEINDGKNITRNMIESCLNALIGKDRIPTLEECGFKEHHKQGFII